MAGRGRELKVYLTSDTNRFIKGLGRAEGKLKRFGRIAGTALAAGAAGAVALGVEAVQAATAQEKANAKLGKSLDNLGLGDQTDAVLENIDAIQKQTGISEDDLIPAFSKLVGITKNTDDAFGLLKTAMDTATATGKPLSTVAQAIARGMDGSATALDRLVPGLDDAAIKADPLNGIMKELNKRFGGTAQANAETLAGTMDRFGVHVGEVNEALGEGLIEGFLDTMGGGDADDALENIAQMEDDAKRVGEAVGTLGAGLLTMAADVIRSLEALSVGWQNWVDDGGRRLTDIQDFLGIISDAEGQSINDYYDRRYEQRVMDYYNNNRPAPAANPYAAYRPMRFAARKNDAETRGDARAAQREARTRQQP
jgi:ribosome assembly protein YihI (activator of Der GTPase)